MLIRATALAVGTLLALFVVSGPAAAAPKRISGSLSKSGYTVIALSAGGKATSVRVKRHKFRLRPPARRVTLHLRAPNGRYAGPIVIAREKKGKLAILGVRAGARLGRIKIGRGYAKLAKRLRKKWVERKRVARAKKGVPIGARRFGRTRSKPPRASRPGDLDADGVPDRLDVDVDGDLILNNVDRSTTSRARTAQAASQFFIGATLDVPLWDTVNANADSEIDAALSSWESLTLGILPGGPELDCGGAPDPSNPQGWSGGLSYCTRGGTGKVLLPGPPASSQWLPFPACCDPDGDGLGTLPNNHYPGQAPPGVFTFKPAATTGQIGTGDVLIQRVTSNGVASDVAMMLPFIFATVPALQSYDDGQGNSATVDYPVAGPPPPMSGPGTPGNAFPVRAGPTGDVALRLTFWRPQRRPIPPEPGPWTDIGKLSYQANVQQVGGSSPNHPCPQSAFSENDPNLAPPETLVPSANKGGVRDLAPDQPANPANTVTYTLNVTGCIAGLGLGWNPGEEALIHFGAMDGFGSIVTDTDTWVVFERR